MTEQNQNQEPEKVPEDFEAFKAAANAPKEVDAPAEAKKAEDEAAEALATQEAEAVKPADPEKGADPAPKGKKPASERFTDLVKRNHEKDRENADLRARLEALEAAKPDATSSAEETDDGEAPKAPHADDKNADGTQKYDFGELTTAFIRDTARFETLQTVREERTREESIRQQQAAAAKAEEAESAWVDQLESAAAKHPDYVEKVLHGAEAGKWPCSRETGAMLRDSDVGAEVAYHLATNVREAIALDGIKDPVEWARAFGRLEARFEAGKPPPPTPRKTPSADPPPKNQARGANGSFSSVPTDFEAFKARIRKEQSG